MVISRFANVAVPVDMSAVWPDAEAWIQSLLGDRVERGVGKVQAPVSWKFNVYYFFDLLIDSVYTFDLLVPSHGRPSLVQLNTGGVLHDNVFATNGVRSMSAPVEDIRYRNAGIGLH